MDILEGVALYILLYLTNFLILTCRCIFVFFLYDFPPMQETRAPFKIARDSIVKANLVHHQGYDKCGQHVSGMSFASQFTKFSSIALINSLLKATSISHQTEIKYLQCFGYVLQPLTIYKRVFFILSTLLFLFHFTIFNVNILNYNIFQ